MTTNRGRAVIFYSVMALILLVLVTKALTHVLPAGLAHEIDDESEAFPIALIFCAYVQFLRRPELLANGRRWYVAIALTAVCWLLAVVLLTVSMPSSLKTLNESFVAAGAMILYACLARPIPLAALLSILLVGVSVALHSTDVFTAQAESVVPIALLPCALDWAHRTILEPDLPDQPWRRAVWCVLLVVVPVVARWHVHIGSTSDALHYERRATEGFLGLLLVHLYFGYWLDHRRRGAEAGRLRTAALPSPA